MSASRLARSHLLPRAPAERLVDVVRGLADEAERIGRFLGLEPVLSLA